MFLVTVSKPRRLIHLCFSGHVTLADLERSRGDVDELLAEIPAGFRALADLSTLESMDVGCAAEIGRVMELFEAKGVSRVVRVIPDPARDIGMNMLSILHYRRRPQSVTCASLSEAAEQLAL